MTSTNIVGYPAVLPWRLQPGRWLWLDVSNTSNLDASMAPFRAKGWRGQAIKDVSFSLLFPRRPYAVHMMCQKSSWESLRKSRVGKYVNLCYWFMSSFETFDNFFLYPVDSDWLVVWTVISTISLWTTSSLMATRQQQSDLLLRLISNPKLISSLYKNESRFAVRSTREIFRQPLRKSMN